MARKSAPTLPPAMDTVVFVWQRFVIVVPEKERSMELGVSCELSRMGVFDVGSLPKSLVIGMCLVDTVCYSYNSFVSLPFCFRRMPTNRFLVRCLQALSSSGATMNRVLSFVANRRDSARSQKNNSFDENSVDSAPILRFRSARPLRTLCIRQ